jgi:glycosyltransferase involved in cell wall biosynthesis
MNVLLLDQYSEPGGAQQALSNLLPGLRERGWAAVVGLPGAGALVDQIKSAGFPVEPIVCGPFSCGHKSGADLVRFAKQLPALARQIRKLAQSADVVYVNGPRLLPAVAMAGISAPVVFHSHSYLPSGAIRRMTGQAIRRMRARTIANCEHVAEVWRPYGVTEVVYNGVADTAAPPRRNGLTLACIGRIAQEKGQLEFVEAARLVRRVRDDCRFIIYGAPLFRDRASERYFQEVQTRAAGLPVEFAGWMPDPSAAFAAIDLLLAPSTAMEATTRVILEAYSAGVPVVAFASGGIPEVVEHGVSGVLVRSVEEMASAALELMRDPARRQAMSAAARACWERRFTLDRYRAAVAAAIERARRQ